MFAFMIGFLGAFISRIHGGGIIKIPKSYVNIFWALPFGYLVYTYNTWLAIPAIIICAILKGTGHGQYFDLAHSPENKPERLDFLIRWLKPHTPAYWYDVIGLSVVGLAAVSGGLLIAPYNLGGAVLIALGGLCKPIGYMIGWRYFKIPRSTEIGEYITGFLAYIPLGCFLEKW